MKKRISLLLLLGPILLVSALIYASFEKEKIDTSTTKKFKTPQELKTETIQHKKARRATGWAKPDKPDEFSSYHQRIRTKYGETTPTYNQNYKLEALKKARTNQLFLKSASALNWIECGPGNVSGRTRGLIIDPDDLSRNTWFTGSVGGGIWKTTNAGGSWTNLTPDLPNLSTVSLAMGNSNRQIIYAGTGEGFLNGDAITGDGIFKTTDKGSTWTQLESTIKNPDFRYVNRIVVNPSNPNIVIAVTNTSIQKSINGGTTWKSVFNDGAKIQQIVADPSNFNILYATVNFYGIVKSTNAGETWQYTFNDNNGRIEIAISPSNPKIIYALNQDSKLYVTNNAGINWAPTKIATGTRDLFLGSQGWYDNAIAVSPTDTNMLIIGGINLFKVKVTGKSNTAISEIKVTTEGIESFMDFVNHNANYLNGGMEVIETVKTYKTIEVQFGPGKSQKAHRFVVPKNSTSGVPATSYSYTNYVDVPFEVWDIENNRQLMVSFRDQDRNGIFNLTKQDDSAFTGREYIYINDVAYSATANSQIAKSGGHEYNEIAFWWPILADGATWQPANLPNSKITIYRSEVFPLNLSSEKIADWAGAGAPYVHADLHNIQFAKTNTGKTRIVVANDGGVGFSDDLGVTWTNPSNGYNTTQFYGVDKHPTQNRYLGGLQDNGSWVSPASPNNLSTWDEATGGDGFDVVWNAKNPDLLISTIYNNSLNISYDGGKSWGGIATDITDIGTNAPFITQIGYSPQDPDKLYIAGKSGVTYSDNFGKNWTLTNIPSDTWGWVGDNYVEPSIAYPEVVWAASQMSDGGKIHVSENGGKTFRATNNFSKSMGTLSGLATHPLDSKTAYALFSFAKSPKILRTTNLGETWKDITGFADSLSTNGFPDVATYCLLVMPHQPNEIWVGTEIGLFISTNDGETWQLANNGLPAVSIWELKVRGTQVIAATHGRGVWSVDIPELENALRAPVLSSLAKSPSNKINIKYTNESYYDSLAVMADTKLLYSLGANAQKMVPSIIALENSLSTGNHVMQLIGYKNGIALNSVKKEFFNIEYLQAKYEYINQFHVTTNDFYGSGFSVKEYTGLGDGMAIHTNHPYAENLDIDYLLKQPVIVRKNAESKKALMSYIDIPLVEEGEPGAAFGSSDFYDYVVVEGTKNGVDWMPLANGYDFGSVKSKATMLSKTIDSTPTSTMYITHTVDLLKTFTEGDTILIRFKLHSDPFTAGWGWVIDNINIQGSTVSVNNKTLGSTNKVYPIPCSNELTIELKNNFAKASEITVYDLSGKKIQSYSTRMKPMEKLNTTTLKPGVYLLEICSDKQIQKTKFQVKR